MSEITIIMPALNVVKYIRPCMESVINQSFTDLEILFIDAGSTDGTLEIMQEYASRDSRIQLIHSDRKSYGYQMNLGISLASGRYIGVVETDDYIGRDMYEILYQHIISGDYDYVKGNGLAFREISKDIVFTSEIRSTTGGGSEMNPSIHPELFPTDRFLWLGLYKAEFVKKIRLNETPGAAYQDIGFIYQVLNRSTKALYLDELVYHYRQDNMNASGYNPKAFKYLFDEYKLILDATPAKNWLPHIYKKMAEQCISRFYNMALSGKYWADYAEEIEVLRGWLLAGIQNGYVTEQLLGERNWSLLLIWKESSEQLYWKCIEAFEDKMNRLKECLKSVGDKQIVIFGAGKYGKFFHALCENRYPGKVVAYCDNQEELDGTCLQGVSILEPSKAAKQFTDAVFVISITKDVESVYKQLLNLGLEREQIVIYRPDYSHLLFNIEY